MAPQRAQTQRASARKQHGDATGQAAEKLSAEHAEDLRERAAEMAMSTQVEDERRANEVVDLVNGGIVEVPEDEDAVVEWEDLTDEERAVFENGPQPSVAPGDQVPLAGEPPRVEGPTALPGPGVTDLGPDPVVAKKDTAIIRLNTTLEDVTIGYGNTYSFEAGRRYSVPLHIAEHLNEKGLVDRWG